MYKKINYNYFFRQKKTKVVFYSNGVNNGGPLLLFNDDFFIKYKEDKYYCKLGSFIGIQNYLVKENYPNEREYEKVVKYLESIFSAFLFEGFRLISFKFINQTII